MGTTLTGTTPQDTYDSLIKVTDNGPLSGSLKTLTDGLGNDSALALSTGGASITGTLAVSGNATFDTNTLFVDAANNRVGIGITTPDSKVRIQNDNATVPSLTIRDGGTPTVDHIRVSSGTYGDAFVVTAIGNVGIGSAAATGARLESYVSTAGSTPPAALRLQNTGAGYQAKMVLTDGNTNDANIVYQGGFTGDSQYLGIGLGSSVNDLQITGSRYIRLASGTGGIQFNGDTAAANALDDYEEGTFTPVINGGGGNPTVTYSAFNTGGIYTKIGNQVTISFEVRWSAISGGSGGVAIAGLPFARRTTTLPDGDRLIIDSYDNTISGKYLTGNVGSGNSSIALSMVNSAASPTDLLISDLSTSGLGFLRGTVTYFV